MGFGESPSRANWDGPRVDQKLPKWVVQTFASGSNARVRQMKRALAANRVLTGRVFLRSRELLKGLLRNNRRCELRREKRPLTCVAEEPVNPAVGDGWRQGIGAGAVAIRTGGPRRHSGTVPPAAGLWDWANPLVTGLLHQQFSEGVFAPLAAN